MNNLLSGKANTSHTHSAAQITSGTLSVSRGGTGVTTLNALKNALGISTETQYKILYGTSSSSNGSGSVSFSPRFSTVPVVVATGKADILSNIPHGVIVSITSVSTTRFNYITKAIYNDSSGVGNPSVIINWIAIGT